MSRDFWLTEILWTNSLLLLVPSNAHLNSNPNHNPTLDLITIKEVHHNGPKWQDLIYKKGKNQKNLAKLSSSQWAVRGKHFSNIFKVEKILNYQGGR